MSYHLGNVDHEAMRVTLTVEGSHDMSRLVQLLVHGNCEQAELGYRLVRRLKRTRRGIFVLRLLAAHGGPRFVRERRP